LFDVKETIATSTSSDTSSTLISSNFTLDGLLQTVNANEQDVLHEWISSQLNNTKAHFMQWQNYTISTFNSSLFIALESFSEQAQYSQEIQDLIISLNSTVMNDLSETSAALETLRNQLSSSISVGQSVDTSGLDLNVADIQTKFNNALDKLKITENDNLTQLNESSGNIRDSINGLFQDSLGKLTNYTMNISSPTQDQDYTFGLSLISHSKEESYSSGTSVTPYHVTGDPLTSILIFLGCCVAVLYILIAIFHHTHFRYSSRLRHMLYIECRMDLDKVSLDDESVEDPEHESNFNLCQYRLQKPLVTMISDVISKYMDWNWYKIYWIVEYALLNLPYFFFAVYLIGMVILGVDRTKIDGMSSNEQGNSIYLVDQSAYEISIPSVVYQPVNMESLTHLESLVSELETSLDEGLLNIFDKNNITGILGVEPAIWNAASMLNISLTQFQLNESTVEFNITTETTTEMGSSVNDVIRTTTYSTISKLQNMILRTLKIILLGIGFVGLAVVVFGIVYSFCV
jgi:hypothetical protein